MNRCVFRDLQSLHLVKDNGFFVRYRNCQVLETAKVIAAIGGEDPYVRGAAQTTSCFAFSEIPQHY